MLLMHARINKLEPEYISYGMKFQFVVLKETIDNFEWEVPKDVDPKYKMDRPKLHPGMNQCLTTRVGSRNIKH
jgi:hypothetical protein